MTTLDQTPEIADSSRVSSVERDVPIRQTRSDLGDGRSRAAQAGDPVVHDTAAEGKKGALLRRDRSGFHPVVECAARDAAAAGMRLMTVLLGYPQKPYLKQELTEAHFDPGPLRCGNAAKLHALVEVISEIEQPEPKRTPQPTSWPQRAA